MKARRRITVLNRSEEFLALLDALLEDDGPYEVTTRKVAEVSVDEVVATRPELLITDSDLQQARGLDLVNELAGHRDMAGIPIIITTPASPAVNEIRAALGQLPDVHLFPKPFAATALEELVARQLPVGSA
jgi:DNA-binding NtrC family response regulator